MASSHSSVPKTFKLAFKGKRDMLISKLKVVDSLLELLEDEELITDRQRKAIKKENATEEDMASKLLDELVRGDDSKVNVFLECLEKNSQKHVADIILQPKPEPTLQTGDQQQTPRQSESTTATTNAMSAKEQVRGILDKALSVLCVELDVDHGLFTHLLSHGALTSEQIEECQTARTSSSKVETMVKLLKRSPLSSYAKFRETLSSKDVNRDDLVKAYFPEILP